MKAIMKRVAALWLAGLGAFAAVPGCNRDETPAITPEQKAAGEKAAVEKALADKTAADKIAADKAAADKAAADKAAVAKAAADRLAGQEKAEAASLPADLVVMKSELAGALAQIDMTIAKLEVLSVTQGSLKQPSKDAIAAIDALDAATQSIKKRATDMRDRGASYFEAWDKQLASISTPEVAAIAAKRKDELSAKYAEVLTSMQESRAAFDPFWADMTTIRTAVDDGLSADQQKALVPQIKSVKDKAALLKTRVEATSAKLNQVSGIYTRP